MRTKLFLLLLFLFGKQEMVISQEMNGNLAKYWFYRWRLRNDFMVMGEGPGKSMVAEQRNSERQDFIKWADGTIMQGYYLSMLAIEHNILASNNRYDDLKNNERELYYAIKAFERLDYWTETIYSKENLFNNDVGYRHSDERLRGDVNGFYLRDDVPPDFMTNDPRPNQPERTLYDNFYKLNNGKTGILYHSVGGENVLPYRVEGDYENHFLQYQWDGDNNCYYCPPDLTSQPFLPIVNHHVGRLDENYPLGEMSQDQTIRLVLGFFTIIKSLPNQSYSIDLDNDGIYDISMNFCNEAKRHATNIIGRYTNHHSGTITIPVEQNALVLTPNITQGFLSFWKAFSPRNLFVDFNDITVYAPPLSDVSIPLFTTQNDLGIFNIQYAKSTITPGNVFRLLWNAGLAGYGDNNNSHMAFLCNVLSNTGAISHGSHAYWLYEKSHEKTKNALYMPFYEYLWGWDPKKSDAFAKTDTYNVANYWLNLAPCVGPHNFSNSNTEGVFSPNEVNGGCPPIWHTPFLYDADYEEFTYCNNTTGWFSGVDYMLLYNTVYANNEDWKPMYHDLINRTIDYPINTSSQSNLDQFTSGQMLIGAFENMKIRNSISGNGSVDVKALDFVSLENGAVIDPDVNGSILIYTDKITCQTNQYGGLKSDTCSTCDLGVSIGVELTPKTKRKIRSIELEQYGYEDELSDFQLSYNENDEVFVYPNPVYSTFKISSRNLINKVEIYSAEGTKVKQFQVIEEVYDITDLSPGVYILIIYDENEEASNVKLVKE